MSRNDKDVRACSELRRYVFVQTGIFIPSGGVCCSRHIKNNSIDPSVLWSLTSTTDSVDIDEKDIIELHLFFKMLEDKLLERQNYILILSLLLVTMIMTFLQVLQKMKFMSWPIVC